MGKEELKQKVVKKVENIINALAAKDYTGLAKVTSLDDSWLDEDKTLEDCCLEFGEWLDGQLDLWAEDEGKEFVIDNFAIDAIDSLDELEVYENEVFVTYNPTSYGEVLDFWFEITINIEKEECIFNINI